MPNDVFELVSFTSSCSCCPMGPSILIPPGGIIVRSKPASLSGEACFNPISHGWPPIHTPVLPSITWFDGASRRGTGSTERLRLFSLTSTQSGKSASSRSTLAPPSILETMLLKRSNWLNKIIQKCVSEKGW